MGERGPAQRPTSIKRALGVRADRINDAEPQPEPLVAIPSPPEQLDAVGREIWERLVPSLIAAGVLSAWDLDVFALFCDAVSTARRAAELLRKGLLTKGRRDGIVTNPAWRVYRDAVALVRILAREFGLTPSARSGLKVDITFQAPTVKANDLPAS